MLSLVDLLTRFHQLLVTDGFRPAIDTVASGMLGVSRPVFTLGLTLLCLFLILLPVGRLLHLVNARKLLFLMLIVPALFAVGTAGAIFQDLEELRSAIGMHLYDAVFSASRPRFHNLGQPDTGTGQTQNMCAVAPFNPAPHAARRGVDIAAAFLCADREDVLDPDATPPADLPDEFARHFSLDAAQFPAADAAQRERQIADAAAGAGRMAYGVFLVLFALAETLTNLLWTLGLGTLFVSLAIVLIFAWFRPYEHLTTVLCYRVMQVFSTSWITSAIYGVAMAALFAIAEGRYAPLVLGAGLGALALALVFLWIAGTTVFGALSSAWDAVSGGGPHPGGGVRWAEQTMRQGALLAAGGTGLAVGASLGASRRIASVRDSTRQGAMALTESLVAYDMASGAGNSRAYATAYAASQFRPLARIGTLAAAMGQTSPDFERGLQAAHIAGRGDLLNPHAQHIVRRHGAAARQAAPPIPSPAPAVSSSPPTSPSGTPGGTNP